MIRALKGAPLSCLMILALSGQPLNAQYLERTSGYSDKTVNSALLLLEEYGLVSRNGRFTWQITDGARQLPLMTPEISESAVPAAVEISPDAEIEAENDAQVGTRKNSESEILRLPSSRLINQDNQEVKDPPLIRAADPENLRLAENQAECDRFGIREPKRSRISVLAHVDARMIAYHCQTADNIGLAIYRIEKGWRVKKGWEDLGGSADLSWEERERLKFQRDAELYGPGDES